MEDEDGRGCDGGDDGLLEGARAHQFRGASLIPESDSGVEGEVDSVVGTSDIGG